MERIEAAKKLFNILYDPTLSWTRDSVDAFDMAIAALTAQPETHDKRIETHACDCISRKASIDADGLDEEIRCGMCKNPMRTDRGCDGNCKYDEILYEKIIQILNKRITPLPSAQPIRCKACRWRDDYGHWLGCPVLNTDDDNFCSMAERRTDA